MKPNIAGELGQLVDTIGDAELKKSVEEAIQEIDSKLGDSCDLPTALIHVAEASQLIDYALDDSPEDETIKELQEKFFMATAQAIMDGCNSEG
jgi:hypothetical protein